MYSTAPTSQGCLTIHRRAADSGFTSTGAYPFLGNVARKVLRVVNQGLGESSFPSPHFRAQSAQVGVVDIDQVHRPLKSGRIPIGFARISLTTIPDINIRNSMSDLETEPHPKLRDLLLDLFHSHIWDRGDIPKIIRYDGLRHPLKRAALLWRQPCQCPLLVPPFRYCRSSGPAHPASHPNSNSHKAALQTWYSGAYPAHPELSPETPGSCQSDHPQKRQKF